MFPTKIIYKFIKVRNDPQFSNSMTPAMVDNPDMRPVIDTNKPLSVSANPVMSNVMSNVLFNVSNPTQFSVRQTEAPDQTYSDWHMTNGQVTRPTYCSVPERSCVVGRVSYIPLSSQFAHTDTMYAGNGDNNFGGFTNQSAVTGTTMNSQGYPYMGFSEPQW